MSSLLSRWRAIIKSTFSMLGPLLPPKWFLMYCAAQRRVPAASVLGVYCCMLNSSKAMSRTNRHKSLVSWHSSRPRSCSMNSKNRNGVGTFSSNCNVVSNSSSMAFTVCLVNCRGLFGWRFASTLSSFGGQISSYFPAVYKAVTLRRSSYASFAIKRFSRYLSMR